MSLEWTLILRKQSNPVHNVAQSILNHLIFRCTECRQEEHDPMTKIVRNLATTLEEVSDFLSISIVTLTAQIKADDLRDIEL